MENERRAESVDIFEGADSEYVPAVSDRYSRKPNGSQDQGRKDEND